MRETRREYRILGFNLFVNGHLNNHEGEWRIIFGSDIP
jgi:hypothetical protein